MNITIENIFEALISYNIGKNSTFTQLITNYLKKEITINYIKI